MSDLSFQYPAWYILACIALGVLLASLLYIRSKNLQEAPVWVKPLLWVLRATGISLIAMLLLHPFLRTSIEESSRPIAVIAEDKSASITVEMSEPEITSYQKGMDDLAASLAEKYDVRRLYFGDEVRTTSLDSFNDKTTDISRAFNHIYENYSDQNLGAVVLASDGIYNEGYNPIYQQSSIGAPIYTIAMGDTTIRRDVYIQNVLHNKIAYLDDKFVIQVDVKADNAKGSTSVLTVSKEGKTVHRQNIRINDNSFFNSYDITLDANTAGTSKYTVRVAGISEELSAANNRKDIYVEVLDDRQKVLILADGVHPDLGALRQIITSNKNYEVDVRYADDTAVKIADYDIAILHNLPSAKYPINTVQKTLSDKKIPSLHIVGARTSLRGLSQAQPIVNIAGSVGSTELIQGAVDKSFSEFTISDRVRSFLPKMPPLTAPFGDYKVSAVANTLLKQRIKKMDTDAPMLAFGAENGRRHAVLVGEGIWKWRIYDYAKHENYDIVTELINKTLQRISVKEDKRKFRVQVAKNIFKVNEDILFDAQVYNQNYELINDSDVNIKIFDSSNKTYDFAFTKQDNYYVLNAGRLPAGIYRYKATTRLQGKDLELSGRFSIQDIQLELYDLTARHFVLNELSSKSGGAMIMPSEIPSLSSTLLNSDSAKPVIYERSKIRSILDYKWIFALLAALLCIEWFLRRYFGSY